MDNKSLVTSDHVIYAQLNLMNDIRNNVFQLVMWSRSLINVIAFELKSVDAVTRKIYTLPTLFSNSFKPYMGDAIAQELQKLLFQHILIFINIMNGLKSENEQEVNKYITEWYENADDISTYLAQVNIYWTRERWRLLLYYHLEMTLCEAIASLSEDYEKGITIYDRLQFHSSIIADYITRGLIKNIKANQCLN